MSDIPTLEVKLDYKDSGLCRTYYRPVDKKDKRLFCLTDWDEWYICSRDGEPSHTHTTERLIPTD